jgi:hypothetical protein
MPYVVDYFLKLATTTRLKRANKHKSDASPAVEWLDRPHCGVLIGLCHSWAQVAFLHVTIAMISG